MKYELLSMITFEMYQIFRTLAYSWHCPVI